MIRKEEVTLSALTGLHRERWLPWDWSRVKQTPPPEEPAYPSMREPFAQAELDAYEPSFVDRALGRDIEHQSALTAAVVTARERDRARFVAALDAHCVALARWEWFQSVAAGVLNGSAEAYAAVLRYLSPFGALRELVPNVAMRIVHPTMLEASFEARMLDVVPSEEHVVQPIAASNGGTTTRALSRRRRLAIHRDHVASATFRFARELFGLLPIEIALVHVRGRLLDRTTGHEARAVLLSVVFTRGTMDRLRFETLDPFAALDHFVHRMDFHARSGFAAVEALTAATLRRAERPAVPNLETLMLGI